MNESILIFIFFIFNFFQLSAKQQVEKRYKQVLQKEGFCEDEISQLISTIEEEELSGTRSYLKSH